MARAKTETAVPEVKEKQRFLLADVGMSGEKTVAFHLEGNLARDPEIFAKTEDKPAMVITSMGIGMGSQALLAKAKRVEAPVEAGENFVTIILYDVLAEKFAAEAKKGVKLAISGTLQEYKNKREEMNVEVIVNNYALLPKEDGKLNQRVCAMTRSYVNSAGEPGSESLVNLLAGKVCNVQPLTISETGKQYLKFGLATLVPVEKINDIVNNGKAKESYPEDAKKIINCCVFGTAAEQKAKFIKNGMKIAATGKVVEAVHEGKSSFTLYPTDVSVIQWPSAEEQAQAQSSAATSAPSAFSELDDGTGDDLPF